MNDKVRQFCWGALLVTGAASVGWLAIRYYYDPQRVYNRNYQAGPVIQAPYTRGGQFVATNANTNTFRPTHPRHDIRKSMADLTPAERAAFATNFANLYQPAIAKWANAFAGHLPLGADAITADKAVQRVGMNPAHYEYIFLVNGITLGVADAKGSAQVDYLNARAQTDKLANMPDGSQAPTVTLPLSKQDIIAMLEADSGTHFAESEIRLIPSGLSGSLNGGMFAQVGGDPRNSVTWKYNLVFDPDGKLAYYAR